MSDQKISVSIPLLTLVLGLMSMTIALGLRDIANSIDRNTKAIVELKGK